MHSRAEYKGRDYDLVGTSYDAATGQVTFAPKLTEAQRLAFRKSLITAISIGHGILPQTTTRLDSANNESLFA